MEVNGQLHTQTTLPPGKDPSVPSLDAVEKRNNILALAGNQTLVIPTIA